MCLFRRHFMELLHAVTLSLNIIRRESIVILCIRRRFENYFLVNDPRNDRLDIDGASAYSFFHEQAVPPPALFYCGVIFASMIWENNPHARRPLCPVLG